MAVMIQAVSTASEQKHFIRFPWTIYRETRTGCRRCSWSGRIS